MQQEGSTAFVKSLPLQATEEDIRQHFQGCGGLRSVRMPKDQETGAHRVSRAAAMSGLPIWCSSHCNGVPEWAFRVAESLLSRPCDTCRALPT